MCINNLLTPDCAVMIVFAVYACMYMYALTYDLIQCTSFILFVCEYDPV